MASFGVTTALVSIVISMFMAGLGLGSWGAGLLARRVLSGSGRSALRLYASAELLVGISSVAVPLQFKLGWLLLQRTGSIAAWQTARYYVLAGLWIAITVIPWCSFMGSTFPLLMAVIRQTARQASERSFSYLYVANVLGALLGTLISAFVLIELVGFQGTLYVAGCMNLILALLAAWLSSRITASGLLPEETPERPTRALYGFPKNTTLFLLFTTGLVSMGMEVVWIRQLTPYLGNVVYAFAEIVAVYLLATVVGSHDYRTWSGSHEPDESASAWSLLALFAVIPVATADPLLPLRVGNTELIGLRLGGIVLFCALAGFVTPLLVDSWSLGNPDRAGLAYAVNVAGCILGPLVVGFWLLPQSGERRTIAALSAPLFAIALCTTFRRRFHEEKRRSDFKPKLKFAISIVVAILLFQTSHDYENKYPQREVRRDYAATVVATGTGFDRELLVNGVGMTTLTPITKYMAHLPLAFMSRPPQNGLIICFGMGTTFRSMFSWGIPTTAVDLVPSVPALFSYFHPDAPALLSSGLAHVAIDDGRRFLDNSNQVYDVIVVDPPPPPSAPGSSLLYSTDFYDVVKKHLRKDGILQNWLPGGMSDTATTVSVTKALMKSFPYVRAFPSYTGYGIHFLASMQPLPATSSSVLAGRLPPAAATDFMEWGPQASPEQQFELVIPHEVSLTQLLASDPRTPAIRDDQPINEYYLLRSWLHSYR